MKISTPNSAIFIFALLFIFCSISFSQAPRRVLFEEVTSANCGPCASSNPILDGWLASNPTNTAAIKYHPNFNGGDPMYFANTAQNLERISYCGITAYPTVNADGLLYDCCWPFSVSCFNGVLAQRLAVTTPLSISVADVRIAGDSIRSTIILNLSSNLPVGNYKLRVMAVESKVHFATAPGTNGETDFYQVFRWAYPNTTGVDAPTTSGTYAYTYTYKRLSTWVDTSIFTVAFVQNDVNKEVINSGRGYYTPTGITNNNTVIPDKYYLSQNYPNPFNPVTKINFGVPKSGLTTLRVYDILGNLIYSLVNGNLQAGSYNYEFDGSDLSSGIYYFKLTSGDFTDVKKMTLIK
ncbi:MAG: T9SS type A sorting domain-containing protein [Ignavibacteria bacterium]|jgi:hypothetical protein